MISSTRYQLNLQVAQQSKLAEAIARGQSEIASGKRILAPSDDPTAAATVADIGRTQADQAVWTRNIDTASALAATADTALGDVATGMNRAKELMLSAASGTTSDADRATIATELRSIAQDIQSQRTALDSRGEPLFRANGALEIPVGPGVQVAPVAARDQIFDSPVDLVATINAAADAAVNTDPTARSAAITSSLGTLDSGIQQVANAQADQGVRENRLSTLKDQLASAGEQLAEQRSNLEDVDVTAVVSQLQSQQLNLQAAQAIFAKVNQTSLFDLIK
ncbi:MAG TPA: flagellin [Allosphingosinicella sp.]|jgi:flagellar hook-associated protein 3 FlgL|nr:flagellin [Allosphingosinicella sp.]